MRSGDAVSAVIFLVSATQDMATTYIIGRVVNGDYGVAHRVLAVLIVLMVAVIVAIQGSSRPRGRARAVESAR